MGSILDVLFDAVYVVQVLQAMGYPTGFDTDLDSMSADEKSDGEGKSESSTHSSNNTTHSSDSSNTLEVQAMPTMFILFITTLSFGFKSVQC